MTRTYVITGSASGIGLATRRYLEHQGHTVIGVDRDHAEVTADLASSGGVDEMLGQVSRLSQGRIDSVIANAGVSGATELTTDVNFFGAVATLRALQPLLARSHAPRAVVTGSAAAIYDVDQALLAELLTMNRDGAHARVRELVAGGSGHLVYSTSKRAIIQWVRDNAATAAWAGEGIALNAIAPGIVETPMFAGSASSPADVARMLEIAPMPLNGIIPAEGVAPLLSWLASEENRHLCGQTIFVDGGTETHRRPDAIFAAPPL